MRLVLFVVLSGIAVAASVHAFRTRLAYGFYRFIAFETLALLVVWNTNRWFREPLSVHQLVSWVLLAGSTALAAHGMHLLRVVGKAKKRFIEDTESLVRVGVYRYIRHPLYASLAFFGWGVFLKGLDAVSCILAAVATAFLVATSLSEESFDVDRLGVAYSEYKKQTKMFIPYVI
ncbi:MAG: DUF1295 domain-containing protein [Candidatus Eiseniibacteriota bacterium]|nr:MAG: DUF1295 domain-containing protein [Candidatus Eisenbacteria bacterium]